MNPILNRRQLLTRAGCGFGMLGLTDLLLQDGFLSAAAADDFSARALNPLAPQDSHFPGSATRVIWVFINGGSATLHPDCHRRGCAGLKVGLGRIQLLWPAGKAALLSKLS